MDRYERIKMVHAIALGLKVTANVQKIHSEVEFVGINISFTTGDVVSSTTFFPKREWDNMWIEELVLFCIAQITKVKDLKTYNEQRRINDLY